MTRTGRWNLRDTALTGPVGAGAYRTGEGSGEHLNVAACTLFNVDDDGSRTAIRYPGGQTLTYNPDDSGRPTRIVGKTSTDNGSTSTTRLDLALTYSDAAAPATATENRCCQPREAEG